MQGVNIAALAMFNYFHYFRELATPGIVCNKMNLVQDARRSKCIVFQVYETALGSAPQSSSAIFKHAGILIVMDDIYYSIDFGSASISNKNEYMSTSKISISCFRQLPSTHKVLGTLCEFCIENNTDMGYALAMLERVLAHHPKIYHPLTYNCYCFCRDICRMFYTDTAKIVRAKLEKQIQFYMDEGLELIVSFPDL